VAADDVQNTQVVWRSARTEGSYLSGSNPRVHFGLGRAGDITGVLVEWPRGLREGWTDVRANQIATLKQGSGRKPPRLGESLNGRRGT
jgi:hypothetical protein